MAERDVVAAILRLLRRRGAFAFKVHGGPFQAAGLPDIIACYRGRFIGVEAKAGPRYGATALQLYTLEQIETAGGLTTVAYGAAAVASLLDQIDKELDGGS